MILRKKEIVDDISERCDIYKKYANKFVEGLEEMLVDRLSEATLDEEIEIHLAKGITIGAKRYPERKAVDPRNQQEIVTPEKSIPYAKFTYTFKQKINE